MQQSEQRRWSAGFSLCETIIAMAIGAIAISGAAALNSQQLRIVADTRQASAASHALQERLEQVRNANWKQVIDPEYLMESLLAAPTRSVAPLADYEESITVTGWPAGTGTVLRVTKEPKESAKIAAQSGDLATERLLKIVVQYKWRGMRGVGHTRELATILSNGGISRVNLPAMGPIGGGAWEEVAELPPIGEGPEEETEPDPEDSISGSTGNGKGNGKGGSGSEGTDDGASEGDGSKGPGSGGGSGSSGGSGRGNVGGTSGVK